MKGYMTQSEFMGLLGYKNKTSVGRIKRRYAAVYPKSEKLGRMVLLKTKDVEHFIANHFKGVNATNGRPSMPDEDLKAPRKKDTKKP